MKNNIKTKELRFKSLYDLQKRFPNEQSCRDYLEEERWHGRIVCPHCGAYERISKYSNGKVYFCGDCRKQFTVKVGTIFEDSALPLQKWFMAMYLITAHKKGISSLQLSRDIDVTQKTAWFILHRIREMIRVKTTKILSGTVEADETYIGGKNKNRHYVNKIQGTQGRSTKDKTAVFGMFERNGIITSKPVMNIGMKPIKQIVENTVKQGSELITDEWFGYDDLNKDYDHRVVNHKSGQYAIGDVHTNTIEGFWSLLKRGIIGIYHNVSEKHLSRYCDEFGFRYNTKGIKDTDRFSFALSKCEGRLQYKELI